MPLLFHNLNLLTLPSFSLFLHQFVLQKGNQVIGISNALLWDQGCYLFLPKKMWVYVSEEDNICLQFYQIFQFLTNVTTF